MTGRVPDHGAEETCDCGGGFGVVGTSCAQWCHSPQPAQPVDVAAVLDRLEELHGKATPGQWKLWGMVVMADQDGTANYDTAVPVAQTYYRDENGKPRTWDALLICEMQRALPALVAAVRGVLDVKADLDEHPAVALSGWALSDRLDTALAALAEVAP